MTRAEREIVYRACERIATGENAYSCEALGVAAMGEDFGQYLFSHSFVVRYGEFFGENPGDCWGLSLGSDAAGCQRILMLCLFAEAEGDL